MHKETGEPELESQLKEGVLGFKNTVGRGGDVNRADTYDGHAVESRNATKMHKKGQLLEEEAKREAKAE